MAEYSTIQQHQPLRTPNDFSKQGRALVLQLDEIFDDIYRRFGRLRMEDFSKGLRKYIEDDHGNIAELTIELEGITERVGTAEGDISELSVTVEGISSSVTDIEGDITDIEGDIGDLVADISDITGDISDIDGSIRTINGSISDISGDITDIKGDITDLGTAVSGKIDKTVTYQTADAIYNAAVSAAATAAGNTYIAKTETYQTAQSIYNAAKNYADGQLVNYSTTTQTANAITAAVGSVAPAFSPSVSYVSGDVVSYEGDVYKFNTSHTGAWNSAHVDPTDLYSNMYQIVSGIAINAYGIDVTGSKYVKIRSGGTFEVDSTNLEINSSAGFVRSSTTYNGDTFSVSIGGNASRTGDYVADIKPIDNIYNNQTLFPLYIRLMDKVSMAGYEKTHYFAMGTQPTTVYGTTALRPTIRYNAFSKASGSSSVSEDTVIEADYFVGKLGRRPTYGELSGRG